MIGVRNSHNPSDCLGAKVLGQQEKGDRFIFLLHTR